MYYVCHINKSAWHKCFSQMVHTNWGLCPACTDSEVLYLTTFQYCISQFLTDQYCPYFSICFTFCTWSVWNFLSHIMNQLYMYWQPSGLATFNSYDRLLMPVQCHQHQQLVRPWSFLATHVQQTSDHLSPFSIYSEVISTISVSRHRSTL